MRLALSVHIHLFPAIIPMSFLSFDFTCLSSLSLRDNGQESGELQSFCSHSYRSYVSISDSSHLSPSSSEPDSPGSADSYVTAQGALFLPGFDLSLPGLDAPTCEKHSDPLSETVNMAFQNEWDQLFLDAMLNDFSQPTGNDDNNNIGFDWPELGSGDLMSFGQMDPVNSVFEVGNTDLVLRPSLQSVTTEPSATMSLNISSVFPLAPSANEPFLDGPLCTVPPSIFAPAPISAPIADPQRAGSLFANTQVQLLAQTQLRQAPRIELDDAGNDGDTESESVCNNKLTS